MDPGLTITDYEQLRALANLEARGDTDSDNHNNSSRSAPSSNGGADRSGSSIDISRTADRSLLSLQSMSTIELLSRVVAGESKITRYQAFGHCFFFAGSVFFLWTSIWDLVTVKVQDDDYTSDDDNLLSFMDRYDLVAFLGPFLYLLFGIVELVVAAKHAKESRLMRLSGVGDDSSSYSSDESRTVFFSEDADHWEVAIGLSMCLASVFDLLSSVQTMVSNEEIYEQYPDPSVLAVHFFLLEAILALWGREVYSRIVVVQRLGTFADVLFLLGCIIDVTVSYFPDPEETDDDIVNQALVAQWRREDWGSVVSSSLWLLNSIMYLLADLMNIQDDNDDDYFGDGSVDDESSLSDNSIGSCNSSASSDLSRVYYDARILDNQHDLSQPLLPHTVHSRMRHADDCDHQDDEVRDGKDCES